MGDQLQSSLPAGRTARKLAMNGSAICAILDDSSLYCWSPRCNPASGNYDGPTFTCTRMYPGNWIPMGPIHAGGSVADVALGLSFACVVLNGGGVRCWGAGDYGELGQGDTVHRAIDDAHKNEIASIPLVDLGTGRSAVKVTAGIQHICALLDDGGVKCWGNNSYGQLGLGDNFPRGTHPGQMGDLLPEVDLGTKRKAIDVSAGTVHTCALLDDHTVKCWGENGSGRLGQGHRSPIGTSPESMGDALPPVEF